MEGAEDNYMGTNIKLKSRYTIYDERVYETYNNNKTTEKTGVIKNAKESKEDGILKKVYVYVCDILKPILYLHLTFCLYLYYKTNHIGQRY